MPGLALAARDRTDAAAFADTLGSLEHLDHYRSETIDADGDAHAGYVTHSGYPISTVEGDSRTVYLEGRLYNRALSASDLLDLAADLLDPTASSGVREWVLETDGDFVVCALDRSTGDVAVLNDLFGRLPVYYTDDRDGYRLSREVRFLLADPGRVEFDRVGIAQMLLFGYLLGERTLWSGVRKQPPASILRAGDGTVAVERLHEFDFGDRRHAHRSVEENARELRDLFLEACRSRADGDPNVVSLSGGHDSRAVAAGFGTAGLPCRAATFARSEGTGREVRIASAVAEALDIPWERHDVPETTVAQAQTLLRLKVGLNHVGMGFILDFFERLRAEHGPGLTYLTGDGGDKTLPDLSPPTEPSSTERLVEYTIARNALFPLERAAALAGVSTSDVRASVRSVFASYPEPNPADRYVHFLTHERGFNWLFEGEDRNRAYFWTASPFYSVPFFRYAMNVPDEQKERNRLYRAFLSTLWPPAVEFADADLATPMRSWRYDLLQRALNVLARYPKLEDFVRTVYRGELGSRGHPRLRQLLREQVESADEAGPVADRMSSELSDETLDCSRHALLTLLTVVTSAESVLTDSSSFARNSAVERW